MTDERGGGAGGIGGAGSASSGGGSSSSSRHCVRILVLGGPDAGKTSLIRRYVSGTFEGVGHRDDATGRRRRGNGGGRLGGASGSGGRIGATVGSDFVTRRVPDPLDGSSPRSHVNVQLWDTAGLEHLYITHTNPSSSPSPPPPSQSPGDAFFRNADGAILAYDSTSARSFDALTRWHAELTSRRRRGIDAGAGRDRRWRPLFSAPGAAEVGGRGGGGVEEEGGDDDDLPVLVAATKVDALKREVCRPFDVAVPQRDVLRFDLRRGGGLDSNRGRRRGVGGGGCLGDVLGMGGRGRLNGDGGRLGDMSHYGLRGADLGDVTRRAGETGYRHVASRLPPSAVAAMEAAADGSSPEVEMRGGHGGDVDDEGDGPSRPRPPPPPIPSYRIGLHGRGGGVGVGVPAGVVPPPPGTRGVFVGGHPGGGYGWEWDPRTAWRASSFAYAEAPAHSSGAHSLPDRSAVLAWCASGGRGDDDGVAGVGGGGVPRMERRGGRAAIDHVETSALDGTGVDEAVGAILRLALVRLRRREASSSSAASSEELREREGGRGADDSMAPYRQERQPGPRAIALSGTDATDGPDGGWVGGGGLGGAGVDGDAAVLGALHPPRDRPPPQPPPPPMPPTRHYRPNKKLDLYARYSRKNSSALSSASAVNGTGGIGGGGEKNGHRGDGWWSGGGLFASCLGRGGGGAARKPTTTAAEILGRSLT